MIGLDTNVLLRLWVRDDAPQAEAARSFVSEHGRTAGSLRVSDAAVLEAAWTLKSAYGYSRTEISTALQSLLDEPAYALADSGRMRTALEAYRHSSADFGDCLIAADNAAAGCDFTVTFDRTASRLPGMRAL